MKSKKYFQQISIAIPAAISISSLLLFLYKSQSLELSLLNGFNIFTNFLFAIIFWILAAQFYISIKNKYLKLILMTVLAFTLVYYIIIFSYILELGIIPGASEVHFISKNFQYTINMIKDRMTLVPFILILILILLFFKGFNLKPAKEPSSKNFKLYAGILIIGFYNLILIPDAPKSIELNTLHSFHKFFMKNNSSEDEKFIVTRKKIDHLKCNPKPPRIIFFLLEEVAKEDLENNKDFAPRLSEFAKSYKNNFYWLNDHYANSGVTDVSFFTMLTGLDSTSSASDYGQIPILWDYFKSCGYVTALSAPFDFTWGQFRSRFQHADGEIGIDHLYDTNIKGIHFDYEISVLDAPSIDWQLNLLKNLDQQKKVYLSIINLQITHFNGAGVNLVGQKKFNCSTKNIKISDKDCAILEIDWQISRIFSYLENTNQLHNTIIIGTPDHGANRSGRLARIENLFQEVVKVPFFLYLPDHYNRKPINKVTQHSDIVPTLLDLAGIDLIDGNKNWRRKYNGVSIFDDKTPDYVNVSNINSLRSWKRKSFAVIYKNKYKIILSDNKLSLFDLENDPQEMQDLSQDKNYNILMTEFLVHIQKNKVLNKIYQTVEGETFLKK